MFPGGYAAVLQAKDRTEFRAEVVRFTRRLGFATVSAIAVVDHPGGASEFIRVDNTPPAFNDAYDDPMLQRSDPVMQHCRQYSVPIIWNRDTYVAQHAGALWEQQAGHGYHAGIAMALHLPGGRHFQFGVDRDQPLPADPGELQRLVADLQLFAVHAQDAAMRLLLPAARAAASEVLPALTPRELETLRWTMDGKTAWEVGAVLGISERTATFHIQNAMRKLDCVNKQQAVLKALQRGLIA